MTIQLYLALAVQCPSTRTTIKLQTDPIRLTSGFAARGARSATDVPPPFEAHASAGGAGAVGADAQGVLPPYVLFFHLLLLRGVLMYGEI